MVSIVNFFDHRLSIFKEHFCGGPTKKFMLSFFGNVKDQQNHYYGVLKNIFVRPRMPESGSEPVRT